MLQLSWMKTIDNKWLNLSNLDLTHVQNIGVYVIWHGGPNPRIVRIGHGNIAERLTAHKHNHQIMRYQMDGPIMVTWCELSDPVQREGVAHYLTRQFSPLIKERPSEAMPIAARSPFV